jgi:hypothetical protein
MNKQTTNQVRDTSPVRAIDGAGVRKSLTVAECDWMRDQLALQFPRLSMGVAMRDGRLHVEAVPVSATQVSETLPAVQCAPWCQEGDGHPNVGHVDDQWCTSVSLNVNLSREEAELWNDRATRPAQARAFACRDAGQPAMLSILDVPTCMLPDEAIEYAKAIMHAAWVADQT